MVTDFRNLSIRIDKNNGVYPLLNDTFSVLGSSRCKVLSVLDLKDLKSISLTKTIRKFKKATVYYHILVAYYTYAKECLWD